MTPLEQLLIGLLAFAVVAITIGFTIALRNLDLRLQRLEPRPQTTTTASLDSMLHSELVRPLVERDAGDGWPPWSSFARPTQPERPAARSDDARPAIDDIE